jgi:transposase
MARRRMSVADVKEILVAWDVGENISAIAQRLGYSRPTVRKYTQAATQAGLARGGGRRGEDEWERVARAAIARVARRRERGLATEAVAQYHDYLEQRVGEVRLAVLHQRLRDEQDLRVSWRTFYRYVAAHWPERLRGAVRPTIRLDDPPPGDEAQVDFFYRGRWFDPEAQRERKLYAFLMTLGHSRHQFLYPCLAEDSDAWLTGHAAAFTFFTGVPRRVVPDNLTAGILKADRYDPRVNRAYGELTRYYGVLVDPARARHPKDKAKVERNVSYARESFFVGRTWESLGALRIDAVTWCLTTAGLRTHGTTGEQPVTAFREREQAALQPLPAQPWEPVTWTTAKVQPDCHLRVGHASYSAPHRYVGHRLDVRVGARLVALYAGEELITTHARTERGRVSRIEHYPTAGQVFLRGTPQALLEQAEAVGAATGLLARELLGRFTLGHLRAVMALLRLRERYDDTRLERACRRALDSGDGRYRTVQRILERGLDALEVEDCPAPQVTRAFLRGPEAFSTAREQAMEVAAWPR